MLYINLMIFQIMYNTRYNYTYEQALNLPRGTQWQR